MRSVCGLTSVPAASPRPKSEKIIADARADQPSAPTTKSVVIETSFRHLMLPCLQRGCRKPRKPLGACGRCGTRKQHSSPRTSTPSTSEWVPSRSRHSQPQQTRVERDEAAFCWATTGRGRNPDAFEAFYHSTSTGTPGRHRPRILSSRPRRSTKAKPRTPAPTHTGDRRPTHFTHTHVTYTYIQGARNAAGEHVHLLTPAPNLTQIILPSPIQHTRAAERAVVAVSEPFNLTRTTHKFIDAPWVCTHAPTTQADISSAIVSVGKGPQENLDRESEIRLWGGAGNDGGAELLASQAPQEEDVVSPDTEEDEEELGRG